MISKETIDFTLFTLVDITRTDTLRLFNQNVISTYNKIGTLITGELVWNFSRNQQRNWQTVLQLVNLRDKALYITSPAFLNNRDLKKYKFGKKYLGFHTVWSLQFSLTSFNTYEEKISAIDFLLHDFNKIPIITKLSETVNLPTSCFETTGEYQNTYIRI